jgi:hypothetical protein
LYKTKLTLNNTNTPSFINSSDVDFNLLNSNLSIFLKTKNASYLNKSFTHKFTFIDHKTYLNNSVEVLNNTTFSSSLTLSGLYNSNPITSLSYENSIKENLSLANQTR